MEVEGAEVGNQMKLSMPGFPNREESKGKRQSRVRLGYSQEVRCAGCSKHHPQASCRPGWGGGGDLMDRRVLICYALLM